MRPRLLDLFCGAGGAGMGYSEAGFEVVGVDLDEQPHYPFAFLRADALQVLDSGFWRGFDVIHASPPCQGYANVTLWRGKQENHPRLIEPVRELLQATGLPWVMENVRTKALRSPLMLCGTMFGLRVQRHRYFESSFPLPFPPYSCHHVNTLAFEHKGERAYADALGCGWMSSKEGREAIPPAYCEYIGTQLMAHLKEKVA